MAETRPNVLLICTDQQRYDTIHAHGSRDVITPHLDALVGEGASFMNTYATSTVCAPSRASMMTGLYPSAHRLWANGVTLPPQATFTKVMAEHGYRVGLVGKLHLTAAWSGRSAERLDDGFSYYRWAHDPRHPSAANDYHQWLRDTYPQVYEDALAWQPSEDADPELSAFDLVPEDASYSRWVSTRAAEFISEQSNRSDPFFLWVNFFGPHHPFVAPSRYRDMYRNVRVPLGIDASQSPPLPDALDSMRTYANAAGARAFSDYDHDGLVEIIRTYLAMVTMVDNEVGQILGELQDRGMAENTLVIFTSDHGEMLTDHGLLLKGPSLYEGAVRVPLVMRWPGVISPNRRVHGLTQLLDLPATILDAAGCADGKWHQGRSLIPFTTETTAEEGPRKWALCQYRDSGRPDNPPLFATMLRSGALKLIVFHGDPATCRTREYQLFDLRNDPEERHNLAAEREYAPQLAELLGQMVDVEAAVEDRSTERLAPW